ncbi:MAG: VOC family protein [Actinobacteria bacterium]|nr:VOC family protein [Actinomycetota bacterium]
MRIEGLVFAGIASPDAVGLAGFFADVLGVERVQEDGYTRFVFPNGSSLAVVPADWIAPPSDTNLGFLVDDVVAATAELAVLGVAPDGELEQNDSYRYRHFRAQDGRVFELLDRRV